MQRFTLFVLVLIGGLLAGCSKAPTKAEFLGKEIECLRCYCSSNASTAEVALIQLEEYTRECQTTGVEGIPYDEVLFRTYGRLYLIDNRLGKTKSAARYFHSAAEYDQAGGARRGQTNRLQSETPSQIEDQVDRGLRVAWKSQ